MTRLSHGVGIVVAAATLVATTAQAQSADSLREQFRLRLAASVAAASDAGRDAELARAHAIAAAYRRSWNDSALVRQLERFRRWPASARSTKTAADSLRRAGFELYARAGAAAAMAPWRESRRLAASIGDSAGLAATLGNLGAGFLARGELDSARHALARSRTIAERLHDWRTVGNALGLLGAVADELGDLEAASRAYASAVEVRLRTGDDRGAAADENNLGLVAEQLGDTAGARRAYRSALSRNRRAGRLGAAAVNIGNLAALAVEGGSLRQADSLYRSALLLHRRAGEEAGAALDLRALGNLALRRGDYRAAARSLEEAGTTLARTGPPEEAARAFADLAQAWAAVGDLGRAHDAVERGERAAVDGSHAARAMLALTGADLAIDADLFAEALLAYARAESLAVLDGDVYLAAAAREGRGALQLSRGDARGAVRTLSAAVQAQRDAGDRRGAAITALALGAAQAEAGSPSAARVTLRLAHETLRAESDAAGEAAALGALGDLAEREGNASRAETMYRAGLRVLGGRPAPDIASSLEWGLGRALRSRGELAAAARHLRLAADASGGLPRRAPAVHGDLALVQHAMGHDAEAFETSERLRAGQSASVRAADVMTRLRPGEALLEYLVTDSATLAFVVTRSAVRAVPLHVGRRELAAAIDFSRAAMLHDRSSHAPAPAWDPPLRRLHRLLIAPLAGRSALDGVRRLLIVPHAELHYLPFAALIPESGGYLVERYEVSYAPSAAAWVELAAREPRALAGGVLAMAPFPGELPGSRDEADAVGRQHGPRARVLIGAGATEAAFRAAAPGYDVIHLATYGVLNRRNPLYSYVALASEGPGSGRMEVHEVLEQTLHAKLLILSACETALAAGARADVPAGEDWVGLVRAFLAAGADNVLATLWPIGDRATAQLMRRFHEQLPGRRPAAALAAAQRDALRHPATAAPRHWAGFAVAGANRGP